MTLNWWNPKYSCKTKDKDSKLSTNWDLASSELVSRKIYLGDEKKFLFPYLQSSLFSIVNFT